MKKQSILLAAACALAFSSIAHATTPGLDLGDKTYNSGGTGVGLGIAGAAAGALAGADADANASVKSDIKNAVNQQQAAISGGNKLTNKGNNAKQKTNVIVEGDTTESNTPPVMPGVLPSVPTSCRLYLFGGGSTRDGAASGTLPIGNDQTCLSIAALNLMERAGGFSQAEKQAVVCKVEGMSSMDTCKNLGRKQSAQAPGTAPTGFEHANLSDPEIRRRAGMTPL